MLLKVIVSFESEGELIAEVSFVLRSLGKETSLETRFDSTAVPISFPEPPLPLSTGKGAGGSGKFQNRNHEILVPVCLRLREVS